jgi:hypothetical protein
MFLVVFSVPIYGAMSIDNIKPNELNQYFTCFDIDELENGYWSNLGTGVNGYVEALAVYDGQLIAGGWFSTAGGTAAQHIAAWNGSEWSPLGEGLDDDVKDMIIYDGRLIIGGEQFGTPANFIVSWDGSEYSALGSEINNEVHALIIFNDQLIAGGYFGVKSWNGSSWSDIGSYGGYVFDLEIYENQLIAGGALGVKYWDGLNWSTLGEGLNNNVTDLVIYNNQLIAGGDFTATGGEPVNYIASWNGTTWNSMGSGMNALVQVLHVHHNILIAGGQFTTAGEINANRIAAWDGTSWFNLGSGLNNWVYALTTYNNALIVGGRFQEAGGEPVSHIGSWESAYYTPGDVNADGDVNLIDILYLIDYKYGTTPGPAPIPPSSGDVNADCDINLLDILYLIDYKYANPPGPEPLCGCVESSPLNKIGSTTEQYPYAPYGGAILTEYADGKTIIKLDATEAINGIEVELGLADVSAVISCPIEGMQVYSRRENGMMKLAVFDIKGQNRIEKGLSVLLEINGEAEIVSAYAGGQNAAPLYLEVAGGTGVSPTVPTRYALHQNHPNPFNPVTQISFELPVEAHVTLDVYNIMGQKVSTVADRKFAPGYHTVEWDGSSFASGVYFYRIQAGDAVETRKMMLLK